MSLLLDALKKAAQEKLDRQAREPEEPGDDRSASTEFDPGDTAPAAEPEPTGTPAGDDIAPAHESDPTRHEDTRGESDEGGATELELEPEGDEHSELRLDTTGFETASTDAGEAPASRVSTDELDAYLSDRERTGRSPLAEDTHSGGEDDPTYRHSLTENLHMEQAVYGDGAAGSPQQAAQLFTAKSGPAGNRTRLFALAGLAAVAALVLAGLFGFEYIAGLEQSDLMVANPRARLDEQAPTPADSTPDSAGRPAEDTEVDPELLIEQEDYSGLMEDTVAEYESGSPGNNAGDAGREEDSGPESATAEPTRPTPDTRPEPARSRTVAGRSGEFSIARGGGDRGRTLHEVLMRGWRAYNDGDLDTAEAAYKQALNRAPRNRNALLGLAAIHQTRGDTAQARRHYRRLLELDPRDDRALAGLAALAGGGQGDTPPLGEASGDISRIKTLLSERPGAAHLHFTLGNLYAARRRWADAQQAYFDAHRLADDNPDYAYNLAVSLEHLGQPEQALRFYRRALRLSEQRRANFSAATLQTRIDSLTGDHATASQTQP